MAEGILIVEDDATTQAILIKTLGKIGHQPTTVSSAEEAQELLKTRSFYLIICDINLPGISGIQFTKEIRDRERGSTHHTFIVAVTGHIDEYSRSKCIEAGMDGYLPKPIDRLKLQDFIKKVFATK